MAAVEGGLWPTPTVGGGGQTLPAGTTPTGKTPDGRKQTVCLERFVQNVERGLWPTPIANDAEKRGVPKVGAGLAGAVHLFPTPTLAAVKGSCAGAMNRANGRSRENDRLDYAVEGKDPVRNGRLNPTWVEWLMGYPTGWTALKR